MDTKLFRVEERESGIRFVTLRHSAIPINFVCKSLVAREAERNSSASVIIFEMFEFLEIGREREVEKMYQIRDAGDNTNVTLIFVVIFCT